MKRHAFTLSGREYAVSCEPSEEARLADIVAQVEDSMKKVMGRAGNTGELRLMLLTCLQLADDLLDAKQNIEKQALEKEEILVNAVEHLKKRVADLALRAEKT